MLTKTSELRESSTRDVGSQHRCNLQEDGGTRRELERCDREIAAAMDALLTGSVPIGDALLWYADWCRERELILFASEESEIGRM